MTESPAARPRNARTRPSLTLSVPDGWFVKESYTLLAADGQANVIASSEPLDWSIAAEEYAETQGGLLESEFPGYQQHGELEPLRVDGAGTALMREFTWHPPDGVPVRQLQIYAVRPGRGITCTATTPEARYDDYRTLLQDVLHSLIVDAAATDAMAATQPQRPAENE